MRLLPTTALALTLLSGAAGACPTCAGQASPKQARIWWVVGSFMLVPFVTVGGALLVMRRELGAGARSGAGGPLAPVVPLSRSR